MKVIIKNVENEDFKKYKNKIGIVKGFIGGGHAHTFAVVLFGSELIELLLDDVVVLCNDFNSKDYVIVTGKGKIILNEKKKIILYKTKENATEDYEYSEDYENSKSDFKVVRCKALSNKEKFKLLKFINKIK